MRLIKNPKVNRKENYLYKHHIKYVYNFIFNFTIRKGFLEWFLGTSGILETKFADGMKLRDNS